MEEEVLAAVQRVVVLLVVIGIVLTVVLFATGKFGELEAEAEAIGAAGFTINITKSPNCTVIPTGYKFDFATVTLRDPERRTLEVVPVFEIPGKQIRFAEPSAEVKAISPTRRTFDIMDGKGSATLIFNETAGAGTLTDVNVRIGFWIWSECFVHALFPNPPELPATKLADLLERTAARCPDTFIGIIGRAAKCPGVAVAPQPQLPGPQLSECEQQGHTCMQACDRPDLGVKYAAQPFDCPAGLACCDTNQATYY